MANLFFVAALVVFASLPHAQAQPRRGTVRLWRNGFSSTSYSSGRVQIYISNWSNICDDSDFFLTEATVVCHQLGYSGASSQSRASSDSFGNDSYSILVDNVDCSTSNYLVILQCSHSFVVSTSCMNGWDDASVTCYTTRIWNSPYNLQIRLQQGLYTNQGLVEVYCNGQWGTVCDDTFGSAEADTVCRQLGYTSAARYDHLAIRGTSSQPIWLNRMTCSFATSCLRTCQSCPSSANQHDCSHSEDVTIECQYSGSSVSTTISTCNFGRSFVSSITFLGLSAGIGIGTAIGCVVCLIFQFIWCCVCICLLRRAKKPKKEPAPTTFIINTAPQPTQLPVSSVITANSPVNLPQQIHVVVQPVTPVPSVHNGGALRPPTSGTSVAPQMASVTSAQPRPHTSSLNDLIGQQQEQHRSRSFPQLAPPPPQGHVITPSSQSDSIPSTPPPSHKTPVTEVNLTSNPAYGVSAPPSHKTPITGVNLTSNPAYGVSAAQPPTQNEEQLDEYTEMIPNPSSQDNQRNDQLYESLQVENEYVT